MYKKYKISVLGCFFCSMLLLNVPAIADEKSKQVAEKIPRMTREIGFFVIRDGEMSEIKISKGVPRAFGYKSESKEEMWAIRSADIPRPVTIDEETAMHIWKLVHEFITGIDLDKVSQHSGDLPKGFSHAELYLERYYQHFQICRMHPPSSDDLEKLKTLAMEIDKRVQVKTKEKLVTALTEN